MDLSLLHEVFPMKDNHLFWCQMGGGCSISFQGHKDIGGSHGKWLDR